jgi:hypothetical protein
VAFFLPNLLTIPKPSAVAGGGFALLVTNKNTLNVLAKIVEALKP